MSFCSECWNACFSSLFKDEKKKYADVKYQPPEMPLLPYGPTDKTFYFQQAVVQHPVHPSITEGATVVREEPGGSAAPPTIANNPAEDSDTQAVALATASARPDPDSGPPHLRCAITYDLQRRVLTVYLSQVLRLKEKCDTGVTVLLRPSKEEIVETKPVYNSQNPIFNEVIEFSGLQLSEARRQTLIFHVYIYKNNSKGSLLGTASLPLEEADFQGLQTELKIDCIQEKKTQADLGSKGEVLLAVSYDPEKGLLHGVLLKAANIRGHNNPDPYGKVNLFFGDQRVAKWKSSTKINTLAPIYNEAFHFDVKKLNISHISLQFILFDEDKLHTGQDSVIGYTVVGDHSPSESGRKQWSSVTSNPGEACRSWHSLIAK